MGPTNHAEVPGHLGGKLHEILHSEGLVGLFQHIIHRIKKGFHLRDAYILIVTCESLNEVPPPKIAVIVKEIINPNTSELEALAEFHFHTNTREDVLSYLGEGQHCFVAKYDEKIVSVFWTMKKEFYDFRNQRSYQLSENEIYSLGFFTASPFRGQGIFGYLCAYALHDFLCSSPNSRAVIFIDPHNLSSLKVASKIGFTPVGRAGYIEMLGARLNYILGRNALPNTKKRFLFSF